MHKHARGTFTAVDLRDGCFGTATIMRIVSMFVPNNIFVEESPTGARISRCVSSSARLCLDHMTYIDMEMSTIPARTPGYTHTNARNLTAIFGLLPTVTLTFIMAPLVSRTATPARPTLQFLTARRHPLEPATVAPIAAPNGDDDSSASERAASDGFQMLDDPAFQVEQPVDSDWVEIVPEPVFEASPFLRFVG